MGGSSAPRADDEARRHAVPTTPFPPTRNHVNKIIYIVGLVVVIGIIASWLGFR